MDQARNRRLRRGPVFTTAAAALVFGGLVTANMLSDDDRAPAQPVAVQAANAPATSPGGAAADKPRSDDPAVNEPGAAQPTQAGPFGGVATPRDQTAPAPDDLKVYYGRTFDDYATVAIVEYAGRVSAYVCSASNVEVWFDGRVDGRQLDLKGAPGNELRAALEGQTVTGEVRYSGVEIGFQAVASEPSRWMTRYQGPVEDLTRATKFTETAQAESAR